MAELSAELAGKPVATAVADVTDLAAMRRRSAGWNSDSGQPTC